MLNYASNWLRNMTEAVVRILAGDIEVKISGTKNQVEERIAELQEEGVWSSVLDRLRLAREAAVEAAAKTIGSAELPERGAAFHHLVTGAGFERKPDMVLAAIHYLRDVEGLHDSPPVWWPNSSKTLGSKLPGTSPCT